MAPTEKVAATVDFPPPPPAPDEPLNRRAMLRSASTRLPMVDLPVDDLMVDPPAVPPLRIQAPQLTSTEPPPRRCTIIVTVAVVTDER